MAKLSRLRSVDDLISPDVVEACESLEKLTPADMAAVKLARRYAATIDDAMNVAAALAGLNVDDADLASRVAALSARVDVVTVMEKLGPKLLTCLESLGATPRARSGRAVPGGGVSGKLQAVRADSRPA